MEGPYFRPSRCTRSCASGFTLIELLIAVTVAGLLIGAAVSITMSSRELLTTDEVRTRLNQNLRSSMDLLGIDVRRSGERLPADFPAVEIVNGENGAPDSLILRRNMLDEVLPLCATLAAGTSEENVRVAFGDADPPAGCEPVPDGNANTVPDNIDSWHGYRVVQGGQVAVYLFNPVTAAGEWFLFDDEGSTTHYLHNANDDPWESTFDVDQQVRAYMLEERVYGLSGGLLRFAISGADDPINVGIDITDFQVRAIMANGDIEEEFDSNDSWTGLRAIEVTVVARSETLGIDRHLTTRFFPRNILSN